MVGVGLGFVRVLHRVFIPGPSFCLQTGVYGHKHREFRVE